MKFFILILLSTVITHTHASTFNTSTSAYCYGYSTAMLDQFKTSKLKKKHYESMSAYYGKYFNITFNNHKSTSEALLFEYYQSAIEKVSSKDDVDLKCESIFSEKQ